MNTIPDDLEEIEDNSNDSIFYQMHSDFTDIVDIDSYSDNDELDEDGDIIPS